MTDRDKIQKILIDSAFHSEYLYHFIGNIKDVYPDISEEEVKKKTLLIIKILLKKKIISVNSVLNENQWNLSIEESIKKIDMMWVKKASYINFINMVFFKMQEWFYDKLKKEGYNFQDNWFEFVNRNLWLKNILEIEERDFDNYKP